MYTLSLFYKKLETKIPKEIFITIFKPNKNNQIILLKSKLGQFKLNWFCSNKPNEKNINLIKNIREKDTGCMNDEIKNIIKYNIWTQNEITKNNLSIFKKENKHFLFNKKTKKIKDEIYEKNDKLNLVTNGKTLGLHAPEINIFEKIKEKKDRNGVTRNNINNKIYMGSLYTKLTLKNWNGKKLENRNILKNDNIDKEKIKLKILNKQIKNIIKGITQGFFINLELKGIGYQAKIEKVIENSEDKKKKEENYVNQLESNIKKIKNYIIKKDIIKKKIKEKDIKERLLSEDKKKDIKYKNYFSKNNKIKKKNNLKLNLGISHSIIYPLYKYAIDTKITQSQNNYITISILSISNNILNQVAAEIYSLKKPEPYKGKGIRYNKENFFPKKMIKKN